MACLRLSTHGLVQLPEAFWMRQVERHASIIGQNPRKHRELCQIVHSAPCHGVECHEVLGIGHAPFLPGQRLATYRRAPEHNALETRRRRCHFSDAIHEGFAVGQGRRRLSTHHIFQARHMCLCRQNEQATLPIVEEKFQRRSPMQPCTV